MSVLQLITVGFSLAGLTFSTISNIIVIRMAQRLEAEMARREGK